MRSPCAATKSSSHSPRQEKARVQQQRPNAAKNKLIFKKITRHVKEEENVIYNQRKSSQQKQTCQTHQNVCIIYCSLYINHILIKPLLKKK